MTSPVFLDGGAVTLHPVEEDDIEFLIRITNDPSVRHGLSIAEPMTRPDQREFSIDPENERDGTSLLVRADGERVGVVDLVHVNTQFGTAEIGYLFAPDTWGNGYATAAVETVVEYGFAERGFHKLYARVFAFNEGSAGVLEKVGFERESVLREDAYLHGEYVDTYRYGFLADEWMSGKRETA